MTTKSRIPLIDFDEVGSGKAIAMARAAKQVFDACNAVGFFYIYNHGVPRALMESALELARQFFAHSVEVKRQVSANRIHRGFHAMGDALMYGAKKPDLKEFYSIGLDLAADHPSVLSGEPLRGPNNWPTFMPQLKEGLYPYHEAVGACGARLLQVVALSLGLAEDFFSRRYTLPLQRTQMIYYPPQPLDLGRDQFGVAPHTDYGCITLLYQDGSGGLQVKDRSSQDWIDADPIDGTFVVNVGDLLARWSNDRFTSTPHRVINKSGHERYSIATFYDPDFATVVDPTDMGSSQADCRYEPVTAGRHILNRFDQSFGYRRKYREPGSGSPVTTEAPP